jgi:hypothetical protein
MTYEEIRRALEVAKEYEHRALECKARIEHVVYSERLGEPDWLVEVESGANDMYYCIGIAEAIRRAIRAAIGSEKA